MLCILQGVASVIEAGAISDVHCSHETGFVLETGLYISKAAHRAWNRQRCAVCIGNSGVSQHGAREDHVRVVQVITFASIVSGAQLATAATL